MFLLKRLFVTLLIISFVVGCGSSADGVKNETSATTLCVSSTDDASQMYELAKEEQKLKGGTQIYMHALFPTPGYKRVSIKEKELEVNQIEDAITVKAIASYTEPKTEPSLPAYDPKSFKDSNYVATEAVPEVSSNNLSINYGDDSYEIQLPTSDPNCFHSDGGKPISGSEGNDNDA